MTFHIPDIYQSFDFSKVTCISQVSVDCVYVLNKKGKFVNVNSVQCLRNRDHLLYEHVHVLRLKE